MDELTTFNLRLTVTGEPQSVSDEQALIDTLIVRHLIRQNTLGRSALKAWVMSALKNQYMLENGLVERPVNKTDLPDVEVPVAAFPQGDNQTAKVVTQTPVASSSGATRAESDTSEAVTAGVIEEVAPVKKGNWDMEVNAERYKVGMGV